jgi:pyruvate dehydrogenase E2 component (dihydrolipoamide acetyltransferase)
MEEIFIPASGMAAEDVLVTEWLKQPGEPVAAGDTVAIVETDKAIVELSGTSSGRLSRHLVPTGARVPGGTTVAYVLADGEDEPGAGGAGPPTTLPSEAEMPPPAVSSGEREPGNRHALSPRQRRALAEGLTGNDPTGNGNEATGNGNEAASRPESGAPGTAPSSNREATAALVSESWRTAPHFSVGKDVRADGLLDAVQAVRAAGTQATVTDFFALALSRGLQQLGEPADVGLAVATDWGVLIPVLRPLAGCSIPDVAALRQAAVSRARERRLGSADAAPPFATLSNLGPAGVTWFNGVVPLNQVALLTVGELTLRPAVEGGAVVAAPMFTAVVTADHRRYDGADSAKLLAVFVEHLTALTAEAGR